MIRPTLIDLNSNELKYFPFMIGLDKCTESCNVLSPKICFPKETIDINFKAFNLITNEKEAKAMAKHVLCDCKCKFNSTTCNSNQKWNNNVNNNVNIKIIIHAKAIIVRILSYVFVRITSI